MGDPGVSADRVALARPIVAPIPANCAKGWWNCC